MTDQLTIWSSDCVERDTDVFRPIHYLGSKLRLLEPIVGTIDSVAAEGRVCDLFAGSGVVAARLATAREVTAVDIQEYSRVLCSALLKRTRFDMGVWATLEVGGVHSASSEKLRWAFEPAITYELSCMEAARHGRADPLCDLVERGSIGGSGLQPPPNLARVVREVRSRFNLLEPSVQFLGTISYYYGGVYFSYHQAFAIDCLRGALDHLAPNLRDCALAALLGMASDIVCSVGNQFAQPLKPRDSQGRPKDNAVARILRQRSIDPFVRFTTWLRKYSALEPRGTTHTAIRADYRDFLKATDQAFTAIYADPPYTRDHYSRFYHVLETIALADAPSIDCTAQRGSAVSTRGIYRVNRHQSPFCIKSQAPAAFEALFRGARRLEAPLILSYSPYNASNGSRPRLLTIDAVLSLARRSFRKVELLNIDGVAHSKLNAAGRNVPISYAAEVLVVCTP